MSTKSIKPNYIFIPLVTVLVAIIGGTFSQSGMEWYDTQLIQPSLTPPKYVFPIAWNSIFILTTASALILWNKLPHKTTGFRHFLNLIFRSKDQAAAKFRLVFWLFAANAILNIGWSWLFFTNHLIGPALIEMFVLEATLLALIPLTWSTSKAASIFLWPYAIWVAFASFLTYQIWLLN